MNGRCDHAMCYDIKYVIMGDVLHNQLIHILTYYVFKLIMM
jgi:hypothetical protein